MITLEKEKLKEGSVVFRWTVLKDTQKKQQYTRLLLCRCVCGVEKEVNEQNLLRGLSKSCGCLSVDVAISKRGVPHKRKNRLGDRIGAFTIIGLHLPVISKEATYIGSCDQGHRRILSRNFMNFPERAKCWCTETNTFTKYRKKKGLTVREVAEQVRYSFAAVKLTEFKPASCSNAILLTVGEFLSIPKDELESYINYYRPQKQVTL